MAVTLNMDTKCRFYCYRKNRDIYKPGVSPTDTLELIIFDMDGVLANTIAHGNISMIILEQQMNDQSLTISKEILMI